METKHAPNDGRVAVVTGGARGIGWAAVEALVADGARPVLLDRDEAALAVATQQLAERGIDHHAATLDVTDEDAVERAMAVVVARYGRLDILVNNAGIALRRPTLELSLADWEQVVDVNLNAVFVCSRAAGRTMVVAGRGAIVNVASMMGLSGGGLYPNLSYQSSKGGVVNLTRALAVESAGQGRLRQRGRADLGPDRADAGPVRGPGADGAGAGRDAASACRRARGRGPGDRLRLGQGGDDHRPHPAGGRRLPGAVDPRARRRTGRCALGPPSRLAPPGQLERAAVGQPGQHRRRAEQADDFHRLGPDVEDLVVGTLGSTTVQSAPKRRTARPVCTSPRPARRITTSSQSWRCGGEAAPGASVCRHTESGSGRRPAGPGGMADAGNRRGGGTGLFDHVMAVLQSLGDERVPAPRMTRVSKPASRS